MVSRPDGSRITPAIGLNRIIVQPTELSTISRMDRDSVGNFKLGRGVETIIVGSKAIGPRLEDSQA